MSVASPCINVCRLDHEQVCVGCGRTIAEIAVWPDADDVTRLQIRGNAARRLGASAAMSNDKQKPKEEHRIEQFAQRMTIPVRWGDMDALGHVNNVKFFTFDESVRLAYFDELARADATFMKNHGMILAHIGADFIAQLRYPATVETGMRV